MKIKKVAVCFYGHWRTGKHVLPSYTELLSKISSKVEINVFFSVKSGEGNEEEITKIIEKSLSEVSNSITINFLLEKEIPNDERALKTLYAIIDPIIMKQHYEAIHGYHDAVILIRPDVILPQRDLIYHVVNLLESSDDIMVWGNNIDSVIYIAYNQALSEHFIPLSVLSNQIVDQFIVYTGTAADRFSFECMKILEKHSGLFETPAELETKLLSLHSIHTAIAGKLSIHRLKLPPLRYGGFDKFESMSVNKENSVICLKVPEHVDIGYDLTDLETIQKYLDSR